MLYFVLLERVGSCSEGWGWDCSGMLNCTWCLYIGTLSYISMYISVLVTQIRTFTITAIYTGKSGLIGWNKGFGAKFHGLDGLPGTNQQKYTLELLSFLHPLWLLKGKAHHCLLWGSMTSMPLYSSNTVFNMLADDDTGFGRPCVRPWLCRLCDKLRFKMIEHF